MTNIALNLPRERAASEAEIDRAARQWLNLKGEAAVSQARYQAAKLRHAGDILGADTWLRIIIALEERIRSNPIR